MAYNVQGQKWLKYVRKRMIFLCVAFVVVLTLSIAVFGNQVNKLYSEVDIFKDKGFLLACVTAYVFVVFVIIIFYLIVQGAVKREIEEGASKLSEEMRTSEGQNLVVDCFRSIFYYACLVDIKNDTYKAFLPNEFIDNTIGNSGCFSTKGIDFVTKTVAPGSRKAITSFLDYDNLVNRFDETNNIYIEFISEYVGWSRMMAIAVERGDDNKVTKILLCLMGIDEQKKRELQIQNAMKEALETASAANSAKSDFLSKMSHDLRTPMNGIMGMTALASTKLDDKDRVKYCLEKINEAGKHLVSIVDEVLDMSRIEAGRLELRQESFSLSELMDNLITMIHPLSNAKNQTLKVDVLKVDHERVFGDATRLQEVFSNLCSNAIKYTPDHGNINICLSELFTKNDTACFEFTVEDNGIGMSEEYQKHLFEPFVRENSENSKGIHGTGLGLPIAKSIINMMGGDLTAESKVNVGSKFKAVFYLKFQNEDEVDISSFAGKYTLVIDDNRVSCDMNCEMLSEYGMLVEKAYCGIDGEMLALKRAEEGRSFDLAIIDWKMPEYDGLSLAKTLKERLGDKCPAMALAAYDYGDIELEGNRIGVSTFISKPFFKSRVIEAIKVMLGEKNETKDDNACDSLTNNDFSGKRALLVEDNELNIEIAKELLEMTNIEVELARDGSEAVNLYSEKPEGYYDIIFMDIQMPIMNGHEATKAIRSTQTAYAKKIPIIAMSANAFLNDIAESKKSGMNEHISKPIDIKHLNDVMRRWLS